MAELVAAEGFLAAADPRAPVLANAQLDYGELRKLVAAGAAALAADLPPRSSILLAMEPTPSAIASYLAVLRAGMTAVPIGTGRDGSTVGTIVEDAEPAARIGDFGPLESNLAAVPCWTPHDGGAAASPPHPEPDAPALILYTSGTTASPKGVVLSQRNLAANTASILAAVSLHGSDVVALVLPLHHSYGLSVLHTALSVGAQLAPGGDFRFPNEGVRRMAAAEVSVFPGVPFHFQALLGRKTGFDSTGMPRLRSALVAAGAMPVRLIATFRHRFPGVELNVMYGQTEGAARLSALPPAELLRRPGSIGRGIPGVELSVRHPDGTHVQGDEVGEIYARGENVMRGYLNDPVATAEVLTPFGLRTRDLGRVDTDGYVYVVGRIGDFAKVRGHRVNLLAVEAAIEACEAVTDAVALCIKNAQGEEEIAAELVLADGAPADALTKLRQELRETLPPAERPREIRAVESIPRTASGKKIRWRA
ncbi:MAG TPA: class I adenylate-forming enzyme family protein [Solirubrobacterales bacterium]|nr:class I adenylate-forming enzyme family protein [Solirubrobacterales bacterium]